jgi:DNA-binding NarL/FixJ family response regulator
VARVRFLIADQNPAIRQTLVDLLQEDSHLIETVDDCESIFRVLPAVAPDVILLGVSFDEASGFDIARRLRQSGCTAKVIIISLHESRDLVRAALATGASGYVFISRLLEDLPAAIDAVSEGHIFTPS